MDTVYYLTSENTISDIAGIAQIILGIAAIFISVMSFIYVRKTRNDALRNEFYKRKLDVYESAIKAVDNVRDILRHDIQRFIRKSEYSDDKKVIEICGQVMNMSQSVYEYKEDIYKILIQNYMYVDKKIFIGLHQFSSKCDNALEIVSTFNLKNSNGNKNKLEKMNKEIDIVEDMANDLISRISISVGKVIFEADLDKSFRLDRNRQINKTLNSN